MGNRISLPRPARSPGGAGCGLSAIAGRHPVLESDEEAALLARWRKARDAEAMQALVASHLRQVIRIAGQFRGYAVAFDDLVSEGCVGLVRAIDKFEPGRGVRLATYARWWIRAEIQNFVVRTFSMVRIGTTAGQKRLFFNLRQFKQRRARGGEGHLSTDDIAQLTRCLGVSAAEVASMEGRMAGADLSLNQPLGPTGAEEWLERIADDRDDQEKAVADAQSRRRQRELLDEALANLPARERDIFVKRRIDEERCSLGELGRKFDITPERVRQIEHAVYGEVCEFVRTAEAKLNLKG